jgi:hypothetical protein
MPEFECNFSSLYILLGIILYNIINSNYQYIRFTPLNILNGTFYIVSKNKRGSRLGLFIPVVKFDYPTLGKRG